MAGARCTGTINDEFGHQAQTSDIERIFQLLENDTGSILPQGAGGALSLRTIDVCVDGVAMKMDILASAPYVAT